MNDQGNFFAERDDSATAERAAAAAHTPSDDPIEPDVLE